VPDRVYHDRGSPEHFFRRIRVGGVFVGDDSLETARGAFEDVKAAFARLEEGPMGKVLVRVGA